MKSIALAAAIALMGGSAAVAQNYPTGADLVEERFRQDEEYGLSGPLIDRARGAIPTNLSAVHTFNLRAGRIYSVYGHCDENCLDMSMVVFGPDPDNERLGASNDVEQYGSGYDLTFTATRSGEHFVLVQMEGCGSASCNYGIRLYEREPYE